MSAHNRSISRSLFLAPLAIGTLALSGCPQQEARKPAEAPAAPAPPAAAPADPPKSPTIDPARLAVFGKPLPASYDSTDNPPTDEKTALGRQLYYDKRLSKNQDLSCNSCHDLAKYGVDGAKFSSGHKKQLGGRNAPTVYNAAGHVAQFWDGRAKDVEEQAGGPMINPVEMALPDHKRAETVLQSIPGYVEAFKKAFPGDKQPVTIKNATAAIGAFERRLLTPSRFDKFLGGEVNALNDVEKAGLLKFLDVGCVACHSGTLLGGTAYQNKAVAKPGRSGSRGADQKRRRQVPVQSSVAAQCRKDGAVLPRRIGRQAGGRHQENGRSPAWSRSVRRGCAVDCRVFGQPDRRHPEGIHRRTPASAERQDHAQARPRVVSHRTPRSTASDGT